MRDPSATKASPALLNLDATFLPIGHMRQISRVVHVDGAEITGEVELGAGHWVFGEHFPGDPIFPGALLIEAAGQLVVLWAWANGARGRPRYAKVSAEFHRPVGPEAERISLRAEVHPRRHLLFATVGLWVATSHVATVDAVLAVLPAD